MIRNNIDMFEILFKFKYQLINGNPPPLMKWLDLHIFYATIGCWRFFFPSFFWYSFLWKLVLQMWHLNPVITYHPFTTLSFFWDLVLFLKKNCIFILSFLKTAHRIICRDYLNLQAKRRLSWVFLVQVEHIAS